MMNIDTGPANVPPTTGDPRRIARRTLVCLASVVAVSMLLAGCKKPSDPVPEAQPAGIGGSQPDAGACQQAGAKTGALLPTFNADEYTTVTNPCIPYVGLSSEVLGMIPVAERTGTGRAVEFVGKLDRFTNRLSVVNDVAECAYQTDRLAVGIYQSHRNPWAVGVTAVIRGRLGAVAQTALCALLQQIPLLGLSFNAIAPDADTPDFCFNTATDKQGGEDYTVVWIGSSTAICRELQNQLVPGQGELVGIKAKPDVALRAGPSTGDRVVRRVPDGTLGRMSCYVTGEPAGGSTVWARTEFVGQTGYVAAAYLDTAFPMPHGKECT
jgi:hypothetical protein